MSYLVVLVIVLSVFNNGTTHIGLGYEILPLHVAFKTGHYIQMIAGAGNHQGLIFNISCCFLFCRYVTSCCEFRSLLTRDGRYVIVGDISSKKMAAGSSHV